MQRAALVNAGRCRWALVFVALAGGTISAALAQNAAPTGALALAYHFKPGAAQRQQARMQADLKVAVGAQGGQNSQEIPMRVDSTGSTTWRVTSVSPAGDATVSITLDTLKMTLSVLGGTIVIDGANGKLTATANGQPIPMESTPLGQMGLSQLLGKPVVLQMAPNGQITQAP